LGATRREMVGAFPAFNCILWAKMYLKIGSFTYLWIYHKRTPEPFFSLSNLIPHDTHVLISWHLSNSKW
jgi:hypothetical protein